VVNNGPVRPDDLVGHLGIPADRCGQPGDRPWDKKRISELKERMDAARVSALAALSAQALARQAAAKRRRSEGGEDGGGEGEGEGEGEGLP
jgi:hypothetical protein